jgi:hypothetical protein
LACSLARQRAQEIWLAPQQGLQNAVDRMDMFKPDASNRSVTNGAINRQR